MAEPYVCPCQKWALPDCLNLEAIRLIAKSLQGAVANDPDGREGIALGQFVTGMAFSNVGLVIPNRLPAIKEEDMELLAQSAYAEACAPGNPKEASVKD